MASPDRQPVDSLGYSRRLQNTLSPSTPNISQNSPYYTVQQSTTTTSSTGDQRPFDKTGNRADSGITRILQSNVRHPQKKWWIPSRLQFTNIKPIRPLSSLQNGKSSTGHQTNQSKGFLHLHRSNNISALVLTKPSC
jgi:hypothetical protein